MNVSTLKAIQAAGLTLVGTLLLAVAGCGGGKGDSDQAVVLPAPDANVNAAASGTPAPAAGTPAPAAGAPAAASAAAPVKSDGWGSLKGQVVFGGTPPPPENLFDKGKAPKDDNVCSKDAPIPQERLVVDAATKGVKNVIVYIPKPTAVNDDAKKAAASAKVEFDQSNCVFKPHVLATMAGDDIELKSSDAVNHNINAKLKVNASFNKILQGGQKQEYKPESGERSPAEVTCDIQHRMRGFWLVLDNPYFAVTDEKGNFEIKNAPAGTQKVVVWQESVSKGGFVTAPSGEGVTIKKDGTTDKIFTIDPGKILGK